MEQIISKLSEIENMAGQIMEEAQDKKKELSQQHQNQCRKYDEQAQAQAEENPTCRSEEANAGGVCADGRLL